MARPLRRWAALAALLAITLQALWPLLSHARPAAPMLLAPLCTIEGVTHYIEIKTGRSPLDERSARHGEHCNLCVFESARDVAPPPLDDAFLSVESHSENSRIIRRQASSPKPASYFPAHSRAPPAAR